MSLVDFARAAQRLGAQGSEEEIVAAFLAWSPDPFEALRELMSERAELRRLHGGITMKTTGEVLALNALRDE